MMKEMLDQSKEQMFEEYFSRIPSMHLKVERYRAEKKKSGRYHQQKGHGNTTKFAALFQPNSELLVPDSEMSQKAMERTQ